MRLWPRSVTCMDNAKQILNSSVLTPPEILLSNNPGVEKEMYLPLRFLLNADSSPSPGVVLDFVIICYV